MFALRGNPDQGWSPRLELAYQPIKISSFGEDAAGELYVVDVEGGTVYRVTDGVADTTTSGVDRTEAR